MALVGFSLVDQKPVLNWLPPGLRGVVVIFFTFLLTGVSFPIERAQVTLERLMTATVVCDDIPVGYLLGFLLFARIQTAVILAFTTYALQIDCRGGTFEVVALLMLVVRVAMNLGNFVSTFARSDSRLCSSSQ
jgi:ABC-2 type transport system permease protein